MSESQNFYPINKISFEVIPATSEHNYETVEIYIDQKPLIDILKQIELPFAQREGSKSIAGGYDGLSPDIVFAPSKHFWGEPEPIFDYGGKTSILECECGVPGCWPFLVKIDVNDQFVIWSHYEQPHRGENHPAAHWQYDALPSFNFDKAQYEKALSRDPKYFRVRKS